MGLTTLSGLNENKLLEAQAAVIFFSVNALSLARGLAGQYFQVKYSLLTVLAPSRS